MKDSESQTQCTAHSEILRDMAHTVHTLHEIIKHECGNINNERLKLTIQLVIPTYTS
jgi:hypothetical protein